MEGFRPKGPKAEKIKRLLAGLAAFVLVAALVLSLARCAAAAEPTPTQNGLEVHFIDVGQALSVLVKCDDQYMLYDGGNVDDSSLIVSYLKSAGVERLEYVFCSHAHEDHVGGLAGALAVFPTGRVYAPVREAETTCFRNFVKYTEKQGLEVEIPAVGTSWPLGSATIQLLGPVAQYESVNSTSLVLRIDYGETSFLLTGDMEADAERDLVDSGANLDVDVLQVGHHGSYTSTSYVFLNAVLPEMAVISVGAGNDYGHPHTEPLSRLRDAGVDVYRTDLLGTIIIASDGKNYTVSSEKNASDARLNPTAAESSSRGTAAAEGTAGQEITEGYIGNLKSKKYHLPSCPNLPAEHNQILFSSAEQAESEGYTPCGNCLG